MSMEDMTKAMTSETAKCQMSWNTPGDNLDNVLLVER